MGVRVRQIFREICTFWKTLVVFLTPLILLPFPLVYRQAEVQCAYAVIVVAIFMITECIPMGVTALLPVVFFTMFGLLPMSVLASCYMRNVQMLLVGSLMMAVSIEKCNFHKRAALKTLLIVGTSPRRLLLGIIVATGFLSMFVANIPTTAMMIPVVEAIIKELRSHSQERTDTQVTENGSAVAEESISDARESNQLEDVQVYVGNTDSAIEKESSSSSSYSLDRNDCNLSEDVEDTVIQVEPNNGQSSNKSDGIAKMLSIAICYSSNIGGTATLTGSGTNLIAYDFWQDHYSDSGLVSPVTYTTWIPAALPGAVITLIFTWIWLQIYFLRGKCLKGVGDKESAERTRRLLQKQYDDLGQLTFAEKSNLVFFIALVLLWFFRDPGFMTGYGQLFPNNYITDAVPALLIAVLLFVFPSEKPKLICFRKTGEEARSVPALLQWSTTYPHLAWTAFFIMGGGFAVSEAAQASGLAAWLGSQLESLQGIAPWIVSLIGSLLGSALTQITSNTATVSLTQPILLALSQSIGAHPLHLAIPAAFACSSAFMLPASTAPNAMVFESGHFSVVDMILCGFVVNIAFVLVCVLGAETWMAALFDFDSNPFITAALNTTITPNVAEY